jgi:probable rRNA maturation factor
MAMTSTDPHYFEINDVSVSIDHDAWVTHKDLQEWVEMALASFQDPHLGILLTNDNHIQTLNRDFRAHDKPTNVLSFPDDMDEYWGDIAVAYETIEREADEQEKPFKHHFIHMLIHGILHLQGHDHIDETEAGEMESLEIKILRDMGIENPYK